jgi:hypothetical protein
VSTTQKLHLNSLAYFRIFTDPGHTQSTEGLPCCTHAHTHSRVHLRGYRVTTQYCVVWLDRATIQFRFFRPSSFNTALQLVLRPHFLVHFV